MFRDENGKISSTRVVLMVTIVIFGIVSITDVFSDVAVDSRIWDLIQTIVAVGIGGNALRTSISNNKADVQPSS